MSRLWSIVLAGLGLLIVGLLLVAGQRDRAREQLKSVQVALQSSEASREVDAAARKVQQQARDSAQEVQREADERPDDRRPSGHLRR